MNTVDGTARWQDRIVERGEVDPSTLVPNPENWRQHPAHQREALRDLLGQVGWVQQIIVNRQTGHLIDGHLRVQLAIEDSEPTIPVGYVDLDLNEERIVLASLDPLGNLAVPDTAALQKLLDSLPTVDGDELQGMLDDLAGQFAAVSPEDQDGPAADERDFWPVIRLQVSYDTFRAWEAWWGEVPGEDDDEKLRGLLPEAAD